jgi:hypothetical protein
MFANSSSAAHPTDADGKKVDPDLIYDAIKAIIDGPGVGQLIVYFAGHGVNISLRFPLCEPESVVDRKERPLTWACLKSRVRFRGSWAVLRPLVRIQGLSPFP